MTNNTTNESNSVSASTHDEMLDNCPFCGSTDIDPEGVACFKKKYRQSYYNWDDHANEETIEHRPACNNCGATTEGDWNTRSADKANALLDEAIRLLNGVVQSNGVLVQSEVNDLEYQIKAIEEYKKGNGDE